ncbi:MAG: HipA family kinase, partial [Chloroflexota bacterium]
RALGLLVPEIVFVDFDAALGRSEPDPEIQPLLKASAGLNLGLDYLPGAIGYHPVAVPPDPALASAIVWLDAYVTNVDRTVRNPNLLLWHQRLWLIDHGAALYFHYAWDGDLDRSRDPFPRIERHVLLPYTSEIDQADAAAGARLTPPLIRELVALIPDDWLDEPAFATPAEHRAAYAAYLLRRLEPPRPFLETIRHARAALV